MVSIFQITKCQKFEVVFLCVGVLEISQEAVDGETKDKVSDVGEKNLERAS